MLAERRAGATLGEMQSSGLRPLDLVVYSAHRTLGATITAHLGHANLADRVSDILTLRDQNIDMA
jgi:hypothetical protein